ncbi:PAS domain-containing sensor histidine kinase [Flavivirga eckloniae]|uniref:histidine kinase n=1 Tax=Flavivirga eckloniae TaxID=1803846 RepID=A0A2K9PMM0_9FLAO|nr:PAS domain-containing sensor histidine kinase [Flavivirga eckloniae]AUP78276.1 hybrid sensor histidine kinase/response regulator [Flavivirga eckloniae]
MLGKDYHRLLKRQLKKTGLDSSENPEFVKFFNMVNEAYKSFDNDIKHIENILEESSKELYVANLRLRKERDHTNKKLEHLVDNIGGVLFETDLDGNFTFLNNAWAEYSGIPIEYAVGKSFRHFLHGENIDGFKRFDELFSKEKEHIKFIFKHQRNDELMWFEVKSKLIKDGKGNSTGFIGTITDVTNLKETEIELQRASKSKDEFLSTMSHEIRTPLNAVTGLTNILLMEDFLPHQLENLKALKYSGEHLLGLINDLLDFDKIKSGKLKLIEKDFSLNYFLESIKSHFGLRTEKKGLIFNVIKENDVPDNIIGDKLKLTQIVKNLLSNSLKFTENGCINLSVKNLGVKENKVKLVFKVMDTGIGISKSRQESIFESFMQANSETSVKYGGTGLGLSISKKLLNLQGSDLVVESELGKGATFSFEITYKISNRLSVYEPDMIKMQPDYSPIDINVLVAEDNKMNVLILKRFFSKWGITFTVAENGEEVLDLFEKFDYDLILMDLQMPKVNGYQATKIIRKYQDKNKANVPIIALTAFAQTDVKKKTELYKMNGFMGKPFNPEKLYKLLKSYSKDYNKKAM